MVSFFTSLITRWTIFRFLDLLNLICICANGSADGRGAVAVNSRGARRDIVLHDRIRENEKTNCAKVHYT